MHPILDLRAWDCDLLRRTYQTAAPFAHVVLEDFVDATFRSELVAAFEEEDAQNLQDEIFDVMASSAPPSHPAFVRFHEAFGSPALLDAVGAMTGHRLSGVETRAYAYLPGHYLLPHADKDDGGRRRVAYAYYVDVLDGLEGGELDLYECVLDGEDIIRTSVAKTIAPRKNRFVLFEVTPTSLHRVREVTSGGRLSLAGWFVG